MKLYIELAEGAKEIKLLYPGKFEHGIYGKFEVTENDLAHAVDNFNGKKGVRLDESGGVELPANYQHAGGDKNPENSKAAGWIKALYMKGKELFAKIEWTEKALEYIRNKEFKYISPEFSHNWTDENGEKHGFTILGVALTNIPFLKKGQTALAFTDDSLFVGEAENNNNHLGAFEMEKEIRELMGLDEAADIQAAIKALQEANAQNEQKAKGLESEKEALQTRLTEAEAKAAEMTQSLTDSEKTIQGLSEKVKSIENKMALDEAEQAVTKFIESGKIFPKQKDFWQSRYMADKSGTMAFLDDAPVVVKFGEQGTAGDGKVTQFENPANEVSARANKLVAEQKISLKDAINKVLAEDKVLSDAYFALQS